jgi:hypothetical protein
MQRSFLLFSLVAALLFTLCRVSVAEPVVRLVAADGVIYSLLANHSDNPVKVRADYLLDSAMGGFSFDVRQGERQFPLVAHINPELPSEGSYVTLAPGSVNGRVFPPSFIAGMYGLKKGCYDVTAVYKDPDASDFAGFSNVLRSNVLHLCIDELTSSEPISLASALGVARNVARSKFGEGVSELKVDSSSRDAHFFKFTGKSSPASAFDVFVNRQTREVWIASTQQCTRYDKLGIAASYDPYGQKPTDCGPAPAKPIH